jgi:hypothetical protein
MAPPYVFFGHAPGDKRRLRPLIEALALHGLSVCIDRPGTGPNTFEFEPSFLASYGIRSLRIGESWSDQVSEAIRGAGAVLVCLSRAVAGERRVLMQELLLGLHHRKLVTCVIDDLSVDGLPWDLGLPDASSIHPERVDLDALERAVAFERHEQGGSAAADTSARQQWQLVARLASDIDRFFDAAGRRPPTAAQMAAARRAISAVPVGPTVRFFEIPDDVIAVFADRFADPGRANRFLALASELRLACNPEGFTDRQITVRAWEVLDPRAMTAEVFWRAVLSAAGMKSRRSLAAFLMAPGSPQPETLSPGPARVYSEFLAWLEDPRVRVSKGACTG